MNETDDSGISDIKLGISLSREQLALVKRAAAFDEVPLKTWATQKLIEEANNTVEQEVTMREVNEEFDRILESYEQSSANA